MLNLRAADAGMECGNMEQAPNSRQRMETEGEELRRQACGAGTLTCHDSHVAVAVAERLHQRGNVRQQPQAGPLAEA